MAISEEGPGVYTIRINTAGTTEADARAEARRLCNGPFTQSRPRYKTGKIVTSGRSGKYDYVQTRTTNEVEWTFTCTSRTKRVR